MKNNEFWKLIKFYKNQWHDVKINQYFFFMTIQLYRLVTLFVNILIIDHRAYSNSLAIVSYRNCQLQFSCSLVTVKLQFSYSLVAV